MFQNLRKTIANISFSLLKKTTHRIIKVKILGLKLIICFRIKETEIVVASKPRKLIVPTGPARIKK